MRKLLAHLGLAIPVVAGLVFGVLLAASPAQAKHPTVQSQIQHYLECLNWMITDPAKHRKLCGPGHEFFLPYNNFAPTGITGMPPVTPPSTPTCPAGSSPAAYVQYTDYMLATYGGGWAPPSLPPGCKKDRPTCTAYTPSDGIAPSVLAVHYSCCVSDAESIGGAVVLAHHYSGSESWGSWEGCPSPESYDLPEFMAPSMLI